MTPDDESDLEALKVLYWYLHDLGYLKQVMEYLYRTAKTQEDFQELLVLTRLNQRLRTNKAINNEKDENEDELHYRYE